MALPEEWLTATPIIKQHRFAIAPQEDGDGAILWFGLLGTDDTNHRFCIHSSDVGLLAREFYEMARATKHVARHHSIPPIASHLAVKLPVSADGSLSPFVGPNLKFHRAMTHYEDLEDIITQYVNRVEVGAKEIELRDNTVTWEIVFSEPPPATIPLLLGDSIHNLRSSLDQMVCDLARMQGKRADKLKFPFAEDESKLMKIMKEDGHSKILGKDITDAIVALRPYQVDGNKLLRALHDLDIADKHRLILPTYWVAWKKYDYAKVITRLLVEQDPSAEPPNIVFDGSGDITSFKEGDCIQRPVGEDPMQDYKHMKDGAPMQVKFAHGSTDFSGEPVLDVLAKLITLVHGILVDFNTKFVKP